jgi:hypothetical protein
MSKTYTDIEDLRKEYPPMEHVSQIPQMADLLMLI